MLSRLQMRKLWLKGAIQAMHANLANTLPILLGMAAMLVAQESRGTILGRITDATGAVVTNVEV
jgi:hypothetical protein